MQVESNIGTGMYNIECLSNFVNFCIEPKISYEDEYAPFFDESSVERSIDKMLSVDSLGIEDMSDAVSMYDQAKITQFEKGILIKNNQVHVDLVWHDNINDVPSNFEVALKVLETVSRKLAKTNELDTYNQVFLDQLDEGVIEEFSCSPKDFHKYNWLPHRKILKTDEQSTFKMRSVFNVLLKTRKDKPSLNEASYIGINIMQNMLELIMLFRTNKYVLLRYLHKAFLQIRLKSLSDRNRFSFFYILERNSVILDTIPWYSAIVRLHLF